jgi:isocitrate/isopropylmalate dehydrogenase
VVSQAVRVLEVITIAATDVDLKLETHDFGGCAIDKTGEPLPSSTLNACQEADAILMGTSTVCSKLSWCLFCYRLHWGSKMGSGCQNPS